MKTARWLAIGAISLLTVPGVLTHTVRTAHADGAVVSWDHFIGIQQPGDVVGSGTGQIVGSDRVWTVKSGRGHVDLYRRGGEFYFRAKGLVLASGDGVSASDIGTPGAVTQVKGTLVCDLDGSAGGGNSVYADTGAAPLSKRGKVARSGNMVVPTVCTTETDNMFLVRIAAPEELADQWIAVGIEDEDEE